MGLHLPVSFPSYLLWRLLRGHSPHPALSLLLLISLAHFSSHCLLQITEECETPTLQSHCKKNCPSVSRPTHISSDTLPWSGAEDSLWKGLWEESSFILGLNQDQREAFLGCLSPSTVLH